MKSNRILVKNVRVKLATVIVKLTKVLTEIGFVKAFMWPATT